MYFGGFLRPKAGSWPLRLALRAVATAITAMIAATVIQSAALPRLQSESKGLAANPPAALAWVSVFQGHLQYVPIPALILGVAALALAPFRKPLAALAMVLAAFALIVIVGTLLAAMAPMYQAPRDLGV